MSAAKYGMTVNARTCCHTFSDIDPAINNAVEPMHTAHIVKNLRDDHLLGVWSVMSVAPNSFAWRNIEMDKARTAILLTDAYASKAVRNGKRNKIIGFLSCAYSHIARDSVSVRSG
jgi:hypothetical protein